MNMLDITGTPTRLCPDPAPTRRFMLWSIVVLSLVAMLVAQVAVPALDFTRRISPFSPSAILAIFVAALICEYLDSSLGMGYGTTLTPLLLIVGFEPLQIVPCVLLSELLTGVAASIMHHKDGNVNWFRDPQARSAAVTLSLLSTMGAVLAVTLALRISRPFLTGMIGIIIVSAGIITLITIRRPIRYRRGHLIAIGTLAAFNKGLSGGGYGPLVTAGQVVSGLPAKKAVAVTSLAESLTCLVGLAAYLLLNRAIDWSLALPLSIGALLSVPMATLTVRRLPEKTLRLGVGVATCVLGVFILIKML